jgi:Asp-tRNA(Asn)/Glu-tRNA(Gln) amidotransferase A subunit family amidase
MTILPKFSTLMAVPLLIAFPAVAPGADADSVITTETIAAASKLIGLPFTPMEREMMAAGLAKRLRTYEALRRESFPNELAPALFFHPLPAGFQVEKETAQNRWAPSNDGTRPERDDDLAFATVAQLAALIRSRQISSEELTQFHLARLKKFGPPLHCVITLTEERALTEARAADAELRAGKWRGPLHGIPYAAKDLLDTKGIATTWGVAIHRDRVPSSDATVIRKLQEAGAVLVAKTSLGELAMDDVWFGGRTRNPWNPEKGSSGSSAGSAAAVAGGWVPFAIGSETLGSIVSPSNVCGTTGLRPTFGRVSRAGAMTLCWTLDKIGPLARSAEDCALVLEAIRGSDPADPTTHLDPPFLFTAKKKELRVGFVKADYEGQYDNLTNDLATLDQLRALGFTLREVSWPDIPTQPLVLTLDAEAAAAFDELTRSDQDDQLAQQSPSSWPNQFRSARFIPAVEYIQAMRLRTRLIEEMAALFKDVDVIIAPSTRGRQLLYTNMAGYPCVVVPNGDKTGGKHASICFIGRLFGEADIVQVAGAYQNATEFHRQRPPLTTTSPAR